MTTSRAVLTTLIVCSLSIAIVNSSKSTDQLTEHSPNPNIDLPEVRLSVFSGWTDTIESWFKVTINRGKELLEQIGHTGINILGHLFKFRPTVASVMQLTKDVLLGLPQEIIVYAVDAFCDVSSYVDAISLSPIPKAEEMHLDFVTRDLQNVSAPLDNPEPICDHPAFRKDWPIVVVITGWNSNVNSTNDALDALYKAYQLRDVNFMFFDTAKFVDTLYTWAAFNTVEVGRLIGRSLTKLRKCVEPKNMHLIGHSLGAHMCGYAARTFQNLTNEWIPRITGLDPAHPCFREGERLNGLQRGDALYVDIIHSNAGVLGRRSPLGDVDFYPNGRHPLQPGCYTIMCSHSRSWEYYAESVKPGNENNFLAVRCDSYSALTAGKCGGKAIPMGYAVPTTAKGDYFLSTNFESPYGMGKTLFTLYKSLVTLSEHILYPVKVPEKHHDREEL